MKNLIIILAVILTTVTSFPQKMVVQKKDGTNMFLDMNTIATINFIIPCPGIPTVDYAGKIYNTVLIGNQCWLKENLDVGTMINGPSISPDGYQTNNQIIEKYCYDNNPVNCATYGGLYQWKEAMQYVTAPGTKGICPDGWHIPTYTEFDILRSDNSANSLKEIGTDGGTNTTGFSALYAGNVHTVFEALNGGAWWWTSTEYSATHAHYFTITASDYRFYDNWKWYGVSVRCIKN
jgi:uncharacterized protein (TIGR02145 family)